MIALRRLLLPWSAMIALPGLGGCKGVLDPIGPVGQGERLLLTNSLAIMLGIVIPTILASLAFAWWFRAGNTRARYRPDWAYSGRLELLVWSVPALVVIFVGGLAWIGSHQLDPRRPLARPGQRTLEVQVVSLDWKWLFIYPREGIASVNRLVLPAGVPVRFRLTSATVMNSFFVPRLGSQIYTMAGMVTEVNLQADRLGRTRGLSAMFSGDGFADMGFDVDAVPPADYARWVAAAKARGPALDAGGYAALARESKAVSPYTYARVDPGLFDAIVTQHAPAPEVPNIGQPNPSVSARTHDRQ